jgi:hypothetical protein
VVSPSTPSIPLHRTASVNAVHRLTDLRMLSAWPCSFAFCFEVFRFPQNTEARRHTSPTKHLRLRVSTKVRK